MPKLLVASSRVQEAASPRTSVGTYRLKVETSRPLRPREPEPEYTLAFFTIEAYAAW